MVNTEMLVTAMVLSAVSEYQRRKELREIAIRAGHKRMATICYNVMNDEVQWLKNSGYPEVIGLSGEYIARKIAAIEVPEDFVEAMNTMILFDADEFDAECEESLFDFDEEYDEPDYDFLEAYDESAL